MDLMAYEDNCIWLIGLFVVTIKGKGNRLINIGTLLRRT